MLRALPLKLLCRTLLFACAFVFIIPLNAQWLDRFDSNLNLAWRGDTSHFLVSNGKLKLSAPTAGKSQLYRYFNDADSLEWKFSVELSFASSATNNLRIYLAKDSLDFLKGKSYYIEIGENGSLDKWKLIAQDQSIITLLAEGEAGKLGSDPVIISMRINKSLDGKFKVAASYDATTNYTEFVEIVDSKNFKFLNPFFMIECNYTETRKDKFTFDDISINYTNKDIDGPNLLSVDSVQAKQIVLRFDEPIDLSSINLSQNIVIIPNEVISNISAVNQDSSLIKISFTNNLRTGINYSLQLHNIKDIFGNNTLFQSKTFSLISTDIASVYDLLITEFLPDPVPSVALPELEFVELYNNSDRAFDLKNYTLNDASGAHLIRNGIIQKGEFVILCHQKDTSVFGVYGKTIGLSSFPSINNSGDRLYILNSNGNLIHELEFDIDWFGGTKKSEGGYTLEMINPKEACKSQQNWQASNDPSGGTPARQNSSWIKTKDTTGPLVIEVYPLSEWEIKIVFNETIDDSNLAHLERFVISPMITLAAAELILPSKKEMVLLLNTALEKGKKYELRIMGIVDCLANVQGAVQSFDIYLPSDPLQGDLVINEVLFNPKTGGVDFIELYNNSSKLLSVKNLFFSNLLTDSLQMPVKIDRLIYPNSFIVFTPSKSNINSYYFSKDSTVIFDATIPSLDDKKGNIRLSVFQGFRFVTLDQFAYSDDMHNALLDSKEGVSLERLSYNLPTDSRSNWQSAAETQGGATPGIKNSQYLNLDSTSVQKNTVLLSSDYITPNGDGDKDFLLMQFKLLQAGSKIHVQIYDLAGNRINDLSQVIHGTDDFVKWDGIDSDGRKVITGNYIIHCTFVNVSSGVKKEKLTVAVINK